jgi:hypothetical protein
MLMERGWICSGLGMQGRAVVWTRTRTCSLVKYVVYFRYVSRRYEAC